MNNDLISRSALKETIGKSTVTIIGYGEAILLDTANELIDNAPTVPLPNFKDGYKQAILDGKTNYSRPQGEWLHDSDRPDRLICSVCNCEWDMWRYESKELKYCPNCGTEMGGSEE